MALSKPITIVAVSDDHYLVLLAALIKSIELNHKTHEDIVFYIIEDKVKQTSKNKLRASIDSKISINWIKMNDALPKNIKLPTDLSSFPRSVYTRLFIPDFVPADIDKILYLDVDMLMLDDVCKLWNQDIGDNVLGAVQDQRVATFDNDWGGILNYKELGLAADTKYFNSGMYVLNTRKWKQQNLAQKVIDCISANVKYAQYPDQYGLNVVLANQWLPLDGRWNYFASGDMENPFLIHFISRKPIYTTYSNNPAYRELFFEYLNQTEWRNFKPVGEVNRYFKKINNILVKIKKKL
jgi:lipopolysaccharide biosynthesis glycosyltransferase